jgi:hypothetical protein
MHPDEFYSNQPKESVVPLNINTVGDAIAYLQKAAEKVGRDAKFRLVYSDYEDDSDEYRTANDVVLTGKQSLRHNARMQDTYVLFVHD